MLSILPERYVTASAVPDHLAMDAPSVEDLRRNHVPEGSEEFEIVLGRRQVASLSFVVMVLLALFAAVAYLAGRSTVARANTGTPQTSAAAPLKNPLEEPLSAAAPAPVAILHAPEPPTGPVFADPVGGALYIQTGAVDRGIATIMAEGLRTHGLASIVAPGPNDKIFRVLVGPFPNAAAWREAKESLTQIGLGPVAAFQK